MQARYPLLLIALALTGPAHAFPQHETTAATVAYQLLHSGDYQSFVSNWEGDGPLCGAIRSQADWDRYMHSAPVMGPHRPFSPPAELWRGHVGYLLARVAGAGGGGHASLNVVGVERRGDTLQIATQLNQAPSPSFRVTTMVIVVVPLPAPRAAIFRDADGTSCAIAAAR